MAELANYPLINQLNSPTLDGKPDENKWFNCVISCLVGMILYYHPELRGKITPDSLKDVVLGEGYANDGTDAAWFVPYIETHFNLKLSQVSGNPAQHVEQAHKNIQQGIPILYTEPDPYCTEYQRVQLGWTHVCTWFRETTNGLEAADPFGGILVNKSDAEWSAIVLSNGTWIMEDNVKIDINSPNVGNYFTEQSPGWWTCKQNGKIIHGEILGFYQNIGGLLDLGLPVSNEIPLDGKGNTKQHFERGVLFFDPDHVYDNPPGSGRVYKAHLYSGPGQDPEIAVLEAQLKQPAGVDPVKVANFQQAAALQVHDLVTKAQTIESSLVVPLG